MTNLIKKLPYEAKLTIFIIFIGISILLLSIFLNIKVNNLDKLQKTMIEIEKLHISMLTLRRHEKDFLLRKDLIYEEKHEKELITIRNLSSEIIKNLNQSNIDSEEVKKFIIFVNLYENSFHDLVYKYVEIGLNENSGLYGKLRKSLDIVEDKILKLNKKELLFQLYDLRKQEQNYILRQDIKYVNNFEKNIHDLLLSPSIKASIKLSLQQYRKYFLSIVNMQKDIGLSATLGLRGDMRDKVHKSEELIKNISNKLHEKIYKKMDMLEVTIFSMVVFIFGLFGIVVFLISKRSIHKLELLKDALNEANTNLENRVNTEVALSKAKDKHLLKEAKKAKKVLDKSLKVFGDNVIASDSDLKGVISYASDALCKISGFSKDELLGKPHSVLRHPETSKEIFKDMWKDLKKEKSWKGELKNIKKDGGFYWVKTTISPKYDANNHLIGYSSVRHDMTSQKVKEEFLANMSHELRTPLNSIIGFSSILQKKLKIKENKELIEHVEDSSKHLLSLINDILDLSKMNSAEFKIDQYEFNAYHEITKFSKRFEGLSKKKLLCITSVSEELKAFFLGDWLRISQIILNLISNSIKFTKDDGKIIFDVTYIDNSIVLCISDNGIGMTQEVQDKIFKPFTQADGSTTRIYGGTGLGLSITQKLVEAMNGNIDLKSEEDIGTTFIVTIPLQKVSGSTIANEHIEKTALPKETGTISGHILVVEDNKTNQILLSMFLEDFGITCDMANDGLEAVDIYDPQIHKIVLMDENMPNMNGIEAMKIIKERYKDRATPIIALTANSMDGEKERFLKEGMDGYLSKPIDEEQLYKVIKSFIS